MEDYDNFLKNDLKPLLLYLEDAIERFYSQNLLDDDDMNMVLGLNFIYRSLFLYIKKLQEKGEEYGKTQKNV